MLKLTKKLWPLNRSLTGQGNIETLKIIKNECKDLKLIKIKSGTKAFDWKMPKVWEIKDGWIKNNKGKKILDFKKNNLSVAGYSKKIHKIISARELKKKIFSIKNLPNAIPYVTTYYKKDWGFCMEYSQKKKIKNGKYEIFINSKFKKGNLTIGEILIPGKSKKEIMLSTNICHPSMANNEISGMVVTTFLAKWLLKKKNLKYSYRILFLPETIGSIAYLKKNYKYLKKNTIAGYNVTCVGDDRNHSFLPSRKGNTIADTIGEYILYKNVKKYKKYSWLDRGGDERQYCSPGIDLPVASLMRSKYGEYPEYHTSLDKIGTVVTTRGLMGGFKILKKSLELLEKQIFPISRTLCEPFLTKKKIYPTFSKKNSVNNKLKLYLDILTYSDGKNSLFEISKKLNKSEAKIKKAIFKLKKMNLLQIQ
jgi:aminopeptidase-like protein|tara:strand:- start:511 stop:1776 length:1266 start_codon:yes stop_codon:yes gene_type:complete